MKTSYCSTLRWLERYRWQFFLVVVIVFCLASQFQFFPVLAIPFTTISASDPAFVLPSTMQVTGNRSSALSSFASFDLFDGYNATNTNNTTTLPAWMTAYFQWQMERMNEIRSANLPWTDQKLLILRCISEDRCGGTSDRLKSIPLFLALAAQSKRLLFIRWNRPFPIEEFLLPTTTFNWSVPESLQSLLDDDQDDTNNTATTSNTGSTSTGTLRHSRVYFDGQNVGKLAASTDDPNMWLVEGNVHLSGSSLYRKIAVKLQPSKPQKLDYTEFYHDLFPRVFRPSPPIHRLVLRVLQELQLQPNRFVVAHYRSKYPGEPYLESGKNGTILQAFCRNAIDCASSLAPGLPVYVAADTAASLLAAQTYSMVSKHRIVSRLDASSNSSNNLSMIAAAEDPPHLNFAQRDTPDAFYSIFVDLWIMAQSKCVAFGAGGFGRFGSLVSFNASCRMPHSKQGKMQSCV